MRYMLILVYKSLAPPCPPQPTNQQKRICLVEFYVFYALGHVNNLSSTYHLMVMGVGFGSNMQHVVNSYVS